MDTPRVFMRSLHMLQILLSSYGAYQSGVAIVNLRKYEETSEKLAEWSSEAAHQLHKTRTTQTSGALAILGSLVASSVLSAYAASLPSFVRYGGSPAMLLLVLFARGHIKNYWAPGEGQTTGTRIPLPKMEDYNEAQRRTGQLLKTLEWLEYSWLGTTFAAGMLGY